MENEVKELFCKVSKIAEENKDIKFQVKDTCIKWSDKKYEDPENTYKYLKANKPDDIEKFISGLKYLVKVSHY